EILITGGSQGICPGFISQAQFHCSHRVVIPIKSERDHRNLWGRSSSLWIHLFNRQQERSRQITQWRCCPSDDEVMAGHFCIDEIEDGRCPRTLCFFLGHSYHAFKG